MNTLIQDEQFALQLYRFARWQFMDELQNDFPRLRSIKGTRSALVIDVFYSLRKEEREILLDGCLRRAHPKVCAALGEELSATHLKYLKHFDDQGVASSGQWKYVPLQLKRGYRKAFGEQNRPLPAEAIESDFVDGVPAKLDRRAIFSGLKTKLVTCLWGKPTNCGGGEWQLSASERGTPVTLNLDFGGRAAQLTFWHNVNGDAARFLSLGRWLGVGEIAWNLCTIQDLSAAE